MQERKFQGAGCSMVDQQDLEIQTNKRDKAVEELLRTTVNRLHCTVHSSVQLRSSRETL